MLSNTHGRVKMCSSVNYIKHAANFFNFYYFCSFPFWPRNIWISSHFYRRTEAKDASTNSSIYELSYIRHHNSNGAQAIILNRSMRHICYFLFLSLIRSINQRQKRQRHIGTEKWGSKDKQHLSAKYVIFPDSYSSREHCFIVNT